MSSGVEATPSPAASSAESLPRTDSTAWRVALWGGVLAVAAVLRFYDIGGSSLWSDEGNTWALAQRPLGQILDNAAADIHPPLYYLLLHEWSRALGTSAEAMRSFSALCGLLLVTVSGAIAGLLAPSGSSRRWLPLLAAFWVALNPFQIYYSQEARMYMLLALEAGALLWLLLAILAAERGATGARQWLLWAGYVLVAAAGLWTHYSFPVVIAAAALGYLIDWLLRRRRGDATGLHLLRFALLNLAALALFAPWLPTAWRQVTTWPQGGEAAGLAEGLTLALRTLLFGPIRSAPEPAWGWVALAAILPVVGVVAQRRRPGAWAVALALVAPVALMFVLGLFSEAFLKFLLVSSAPWCILVAASAETGSRPRPVLLLRLLSATLAVALAVVTLSGYYGEPLARDNYKGIAAYVRAMADPGRDVVLLDAPGQLDVWSVYDPGVPVLALPAQRPADREATLDELTRALEGKRTAYALFWATDEADSEGIVEGWLDTNWHRGLESWQGNVRLVEYLAPGHLACEARDERFGDSLRLISACLPETPGDMESGRPLGVELEWVADAPIGDNLKVSVQMVDARGQVVAQHDAEPAGDSRPTSTWQPGEAVLDRHAIFIPVGSPPGVHDVNVVVYDPVTGERLTTATGDSLRLGSVEIHGSNRWPPVEVLPIQHPIRRAMGPVRLLGYDIYKQGYAHAPETRLEPGDTAHITLYWQAPSPLTADWPADAVFTLTQGGETLTAPLAGGSYPTSQWQPSEIVRAAFDITYDGARWGTLAFGDETVRLGELPR